MFVDGIGAIVHALQVIRLPEPGKGVVCRFGHGLFETDLLSQ